MTLPIFDAMLRTTLNAFGVSATYTRDGLTVSIRKAVFDKNYIAVDPDTGATITSENPMLGVRLEELPDGKARSGDTVVVEGVTYRVVDQQKDSEGHAKLILKRQ